MAKNSKDSKLNILNQTRDRTPLPRPVIFRDKSKYDRNNDREYRRDEEDDWWLSEEEYE